jgi:copper chaperone
MIAFTVPDMTCANCLAAITRAVRAEDAEAVVTADLPAHRLQIESQGDPARLAAAIAGAGFTPGPAT